MPDIQPDDPHTDPYGNKKALSTWKELFLASLWLVGLPMIGAFLGCFLYHLFLG